MEHGSPQPGDTSRSPLLRDLSYRQRIGLGAAALSVLIGLGWTVLAGTTDQLVPLPTGESVTPVAIRELQQAFRDAGMTDFRQQGDQLLVPMSRLNEYVALLPSTSRAGDNWASEWERQNERLTPFSSSRAREATREIARAKQITGMLTQLPDVQQADVVWDEDEGRGWRDAPQARATVYLQPVPGRVLTLDVIRSVRHAVAGSKRNLDPTDVVVMDLARQITYEGELPSIAGEELLPSLRSLAELYRREMTASLPALADARVEVSVDLPRFFAFLKEHTHAASRQLSSSAPTLLRVTVDMPETPPDESRPESLRGEELQRQIAALTGIGAGPAEAAQIAIVFPEPSESPPAPASHVAVADLLLNADWRRQMAAIGGGLAILFWLLVRRRRRTPAAAGFPTLHAVNSSSRPMIERFDDLATLDTTALRQSYPHATARRWAVALRGSNGTLSEHLAAALDPADAHDLRSHCRSLGPVTVGDIESSRQRILDSILDSAS